MDRYFTMDDGTKVYAQVEEGDGTPIVLVHGLGLNHDMWRYQIPYLKQRDYYVVAIDLRGVGNSGLSLTGYSYETWASDIGEIIQQLGLHNVMLAGCSIGGAISMYYTSNGVNPPVDRLALISAAGPYMGFRRYFWQMSIDIISSVPRDVAFQQFFAASFLPLSPTALEWPYQWIYDMFASASKEAMIAGLTELRDRDLRQDVAAIRTTTRIFHGIWDQFVPFRVSQEQRDLIVGSIRRPFLWSGHAIFLEEGDKLSSELHDFAR